MSNGSSRVILNGYTVLRPEMFKFWDKMNPAFLKFLDLVLQGAGYNSDTVVITSDWRDPQAQASQVGTHGGASHSLHELGCAVDLRMPRRSVNGKPDYAKLGLVDEAVCLYRRGTQTEVEIDITPDDMHIHIGQWIGLKGPLFLEVTCRHLQPVSDA